MKIRRHSQRLWSVLSGLAQSLTLRVSPDDELAVILDINNMDHFRPLRWLSIIFELAGLNVYVKARSDRRTLHVADAVEWHPNVRIIWPNPPPSDRLILCTDRLEPVRNNRYRKCIHLQYNYGPKAPLPDDSHFTIPFTMHTQIYGQYHDHKRLDSFRGQSRKTRLLFAGNTNPGYDNALIREVCGVLGRHEITEHLKECDSIELISNLSHWHQILTRGDRNKLVFLSGIRIDQQDWLKTVASSDFFLAPPGVLFPLAHGAVEAMAVGTIPILNYPDWFFPNLVDGESCITFTNLEDLDTQIERIANMDTAEIEKLRQGVISYYEHYLDPEKFVKRLLQAPHQTLTLHVLDESERAVRRAMAHKIPQDTLSSG